MSVTVESSIGRQERRILAFFERFGGEYSRIELEGLKVLGDVPSSSYVRAVSYAEDWGYIEKVRRIRGPYGPPIWRYRLKKNTNQPKLF